MALEVGSRLGVFEVTGRLGEGGMGVVYRATDTSLNRDVALKVLPDAFATDPERLARFEREAKVLASLNHPNIAAIYGLEKSDDTRALILELVEGPTLQDRIARGPIPLDEALPIARQIAEALEAAHEQGIIHRDLKPANVKVKDDGTVKVLDFGLAKALQPDLSDLDAANSPTMTMTAAATKMGVIMGTAAYMSPEQAVGKAADKRSDLWSFGVVLFEMLTGRALFTGETVSHVLAEVLKTDPDWTMLPATTPALIRRLLRRCLERNPKQRLPDAAMVRLDIDEADATPDAAVTGVTAPVAQPALWQRPVPAVIAFLLMAATGLAVWSLARPAPGRLTRFPIPLPAGQDFTAQFSNEGRGLVAVSPDGANFVYAANGNLWLRPVDQLQASLVSGTENASSPFFSPDSQSIGFWANGQLRKVAVSGGATVMVAEVENSPDGATWGDNDLILYGYDGGILQVSGAGGMPEITIPLDSPEAAHGPQLLPGGEWVLYTWRSGGPGTWGQAKIVVQSITTGERAVLFEGRDARHLPTGHLVYVLDNVLFAVPFDVGSRVVTGGPVPLVEDVAHAGATGGAAHFSVSSDGTLVYVPGASGSAGGTLAWLSRTGEETLIAAPERTYGRTRVSPDGTRIAAVITSEDGNTDVWIWRLDQGPLTRLTFDESLDMDPIWTPDNSRIVFYSARDGGGLFWKAADGTGEVERLLESEASGVTQAIRPWGWSPDGRLLFDQRTGPGRNIGILTVEGERKVEMLFESDFISEAAPALSPDGRWLAYQSNESGEFEVYVQPFPNIDDGKWQVSTSGGGFPVWSPDGTQLFYVASRNRLMASDVETDPTFTPGAPTQVLNPSGDAQFGGGRYDLAPDGERFLVQKPGGRGSAADSAFAGMIVVLNWHQELLEQVPVP